MPLDPHRIKFLREQQRLSLQEAATRAGLKTRQQWFRIESGARSNITPDTLLAIARALGVSMEELMTGPVPKRAGRKGK